MQWKTTLLFVFPVMFSVNNFSSSSRQVRKCEGSADEALMCFSFSPDKLSFRYHQATQSPSKPFPINVSCLNLYTISCVPHLYPGTRRSYYFSYKNHFQPLCESLVLVLLADWRLSGPCVCGKWSSHFCLSRSLVASSKCTDITSFEVFHNSRVNRWIKQNKIDKNLTDLAKDWTQVACLAVGHSNHHTRKFSVLVWDCKWILIYAWIILFNLSNLSN